MYMLDAEAAEWGEKHLKQIAQKNIRNQRRKLRNEARRLAPQVHAMWGPICFYCNNEIANTIDHVVPLCKGGTNDLSNLRPACQRCNVKKGNKDLEEFMPSLLSRLPYRKAV